MKEIAIQATNLTKKYRLYKKILYQFLDIVGLLRPDPNKYSEHTAINNLNLTIHKGEKVAIIGRNGAGKSTLIKLISQIIQPTEGTITVNGKLQALLEIGSTFHPEFTGR